MSGISPEQRVRQVLNLIWLTERCMQLPRTSLAERAQWAAEMERARHELALIDPVPELPEDLARALVSAREPAPRPAAPGASAPPANTARSPFRAVAGSAERGSRTYRGGE